MSNEPSKRLKLTPNETNIEQKIQNNQIPKPKNQESEEQKQQQNQEQTPNNNQEETTNNTNQNNTIGYTKNNKRQGPETVQNKKRQRKKHDQTEQQKEVDTKGINEKEENEYTKAMKITFHDELEQYWEQMATEEHKTHDETRALNREAYAHPNDQNLLIYPERRDREPWTEQIELKWLEQEPQTQAQIRKEQLALRELQYSSMD